MFLSGTRSGSLLLQVPVAFPEHIYQSARLSFQVRAAVGGRGDSRIQSADKNPVNSLYGRLRTSDDLETRRVDAADAMAEVASEGPRAQGTDSEH